MQNWIWALGLLIGVSFMQSPLNRALSRAEPSVSLAASELDEYRLFLFAASSFMQSYAGQSGELFWSDLSNSNALPAALKAHSFSALWKVMVLSDHTWVVCSPLGERALGMQSQFMSGHHVSWLPINSSLKNQITGDQLRYMDESSQSQALCQ